MTGYLYAIGDDQSVKFGYSRDPVRRFNMIRTGNAGECELIGVVPATMAQEQRLHDLLASRRIRGEWYSRHDRVVSTVISMLRPFDKDKHQIAPLDTPRRVIADVGLNEAISAMGTAGALANALGVTAQALSQWRQVPPLRVIEVERITGVSRHVLRPDMYPVEETGQ